MRKEEHNLCEPLWAALSRNLIIRDDRPDDFSSEMSCSALSCNAGFDLPSRVLSDYHFCYNALVDLGDILDHIMLFVINKTWSHLGDVFTISHYRRLYETTDWCMNRYVTLYVDDTTLEHISLKCCSKLRNNLFGITARLCCLVNCILKKK